MKIEYIDYLYDGADKAKRKYTKLDAESLVWLKHFQAHLQFS